MTSIKRVSVSAPGKLVLFGEHAVVYGQPCIVTAADQRLFLTLEVISEPVLIVVAPETTDHPYKKPLKKLGSGVLYKGTQFIEIAVKNWIETTGTGNVGFKITTRSELSATVGIGSSSAVVVGVIKALAELFQKKTTPQEMFALCYKIVLDIQGVGSGVDIAAALYGGTLKYVSPGKVMHPLKVKNIPLIVGYTGVKADTVTIVKEVLQHSKKYPHLYTTIFTLMSDIVLHAEKALEKGDFKEVGELMNINQGLLESLGVSSEVLSKLIYAAREAGSFGAKLSGAGGGDCMIALASKEKKTSVAKGIISRGGRIIEVSVHAEGVRVEKI